MAMRRRHKGAGGYIAALVLVVLVVNGCAPTDPASKPTATATGSNSRIFPTSKIAPLVAAIPKRTVKELPGARLAPGLVPPTNRWFSGLVFGTPSMPVFPLPLSFQLTTGGFSFGLPTISSQPAVITGGFAPIISANVGADSQVVTAYDTASVTIAQRAGRTQLGHTVIAEGSPFVSFTAEKSVTVTLGQPFKKMAGVGAWTTEIGGVTYGLVSSGSLTGEGGALLLTRGQSSTWFVLSSGGSLEAFVTAAGHPITGTSFNWSSDAEVAKTSISYETLGDVPTIVAAMPHQSARLASGISCDSGTYPSIYGTLHACAVSTLSWSTPTIHPAGSLHLAQLSASQKARLAAQVTSDLASTRDEPADTYYGGKWLYRLVNLLEIATQVGADDAAATITTKLVHAIDEWTDPKGCAVRDSRCFVYDSAAKGIVGLQPSFGSDEFNDHHFHYGYFFYAAGVLAAHHPELAARWAPVINLLAADLATTAKSSYFPDQRVFDAYSGHSWASGTSPFGDGNNQESSSEAVSAWNGLALWAAASSQSALESEAKWMLSAEATSSKAYWTDFPLDANVYQGFDHTVTSLVWSGKRDYATFFSADPSSKLGIIVLPMSPVADYLGGDPARVAINLADSVPNGYDVVFGDFLLMYRALEGPAAAASALQATTALNEDRINDGNSRSYLLAWIMAHL
jgi:endo-1,3(4)-beta-glucanase